MSHRGGQAYGEGWSGHLVGTLKKEDATLTCAGILWQESMCSIRPGAIGGPRRGFPFRENSGSLEGGVLIINSSWLLVSGNKLASRLQLDGMHDDDIGVRLEEGRYHLKRAHGNKCHVET